MIFTLVSDALSDDDRCVFFTVWLQRPAYLFLRTTYLYLLAFGPHCTRFISPRVAAFLMGRGLFAPFWLGIVVLALLFIVIPFVVERKSPRRRGKRDTHTSSSSPTHMESGKYSSEDEEEEDDGLRSSDALLDPQPSRRRSFPRTRPDRGHEHDNSANDHLSQFPRSRALTRQITQFLRAQFRDIFMLLTLPITRFCLAAVYLKKIGFASSVFAFQYVSEKFGWELHETTWLRVVSGAGAIAISAVAPALTRRLIKRGIDAPAIDMNSIRGALAVLSGSFLVTRKATGSMPMMICKLYMCIS
jgi:hypothetical protein